MSEERQRLADEVENYRRIEEILPGRWAEDTVQANGIRQHYYRTGGTKPPIVLLHGILSGALTWTRVARALESDYDVVMLDARGHGRSERVGTEFSPELLTEDVAAFVRVLGLDRPHLLGHSMGGATAALVAARCPELVRSIVLEDAVWADRPAMTQAAVNSEGYQAWLDVYVDYLGRLKTLDHQERLLAALSRLPPGPGLWPEEEMVPWVEAQAQLDLDLVERGALLWTAMQPAVPMSELVARISCPILLLTGEHGNCDPQGVQQVVAKWRNGRHVPIERAGHLIHLDQFDRFVAIVKEFLKEH